MQGRVEDVGVNARTRGLRVATSGERQISVRAAYRRLYRWIALTDVASVSGALLVSYWARFGFDVPSGTFAILLLVSPLAILTLYAGFHLYDAYRYAPAEEFRRIIFAVSMGVGAILVVSFWSKTDYSRLWLALSWAIALVAALGSRRVWHSYVHRQRVQGRLSFPHGRRRHERGGAAPGPPDAAALVRVPRDRHGLDGPGFRPAGGRRPDHGDGRRPP